MKYYILYKDENHGPLTPSEMEQYDLNPKSRVWASGWPSWKDAEEVEEIMDYLNQREAQIRKEREAKRRDEQEAKAKKEQEAKVSHEQPQAQAQAQIQAQDDPEPEQDEESKWYYVINNQQYGPVTEAELRNMGIGPDTFVWNESFGEGWISASQVPALADLFTPVQPVQPAVVTPPSPAMPAGTFDNHYGGDLPEVEPINGIYNAGIIGTILAVIAIVLCLVKGEYFNGEEMLAFLGVCAFPSVILSVSSLVTGKACANSSKHGNESKAFKNKGLSLGLGIGAIISAIAGIGMVAALELNLF